MRFPQRGDAFFSREDPQLRAPRKYMIVYADLQSGDEGRRLQEALQQVQGRFESEHCEHLEALQDRLKQVHGYRDLHVYVFLADTRERLETLLGLGSLLEDRKIVLILPDDAKATYSLGFRMYPRFVTLMPGRYHDLCSVLTEMFRTKDR